MVKRYLLWIVGIVLIILSCERDKLPVPSTECTDELSYQSDIESIIQTSCAYAGCHISGTPGIIDYSTYNGLLQVIESGAFEERVLIQMNMPPMNANGPTSLTEDQKNKIRCWLQQGYPE